MRAIVLAGAILFSSAALADDDLKCETGPIIKTFGGTPWKVFGCNDDRHLQFVAVPNSPAGQVLFMLFFENNSWQVLEMGIMTRASGQAEGEIRSLSEPEITALIEATKHP
jgi:hypothetical protein